MVDLAVMVSLVIVVVVLVEMEMGKVDVAVVTMVVVEVPKKIKKKVVRRINEFESKVRIPLISPFISSCNRGTPQPPPLKLPLLPRHLETSKVPKVPLRSDSKSIL